MKFFDRLLCIFSSQIRRYVGFIFAGITCLLGMLLFAKLVYFYGIEVFLTIYYVLFLLLALRIVNDIRDWLELPTANLVKIAGLPVINLVLVRFLLLLAVNTLAVLGMGYVHEQIRLLYYIFDLESFGITKWFLLPTLSLVVGLAKMISKSCSGLSSNLLFYGNAILACGLAAALLLYLATVNSLVSLAAGLVIALLSIAGMNYLWKHKYSSTV